MQPLVVGGEHGNGGLGVFLQHFLDAQAEAGNQPRLVDALLVEAGDAGVAVLVLRLDDLHRDDVAQFLRVVVLSAEIDLERTWHTDGVVGRVWHDRELLGVDQQRGSPADIGPLDDVAELRIEVTGQAVVRLVVVLVGVEQAVVDVRLDLGVHLLDRGHRNPFVSRHRRTT